MGKTALFSCPCRATTPTFLAHFRQNTGTFCPMLPIYLPDHALARRAHSHAHPDIHPFSSSSLHIFFMLRATTSNIPSQEEMGTFPVEKTYYSGVLLLFSFSR